MTHANFDAQKHRRYLRELAGPCQSKAAQRLLARLAEPAQRAHVRIPGLAGPEPPGLDEVRAIFSRHMPPAAIGQPLTLEQAGRLEELVARLRDSGSDERRCARAVCGTISRAMRLVYGTPLPFTTEFAVSLGLVDYARHLVEGAPNEATGRAEARRFLARFPIRADRLDTLFSRGALSSHAIHGRQTLTAPQVGLLDDIKAFASRLGGPHDILHLDRNQDPEAQQLYARGKQAFGNWRNARTRAGFGWAWTVAQMRAVGDYDAVRLHYLAGDGDAVRALQQKWRLHQTREWRPILQNIIDIKGHLLHEDAEFFGPEEQALMARQAEQYGHTEAGHRGCQSEFERAVRRYVATLRLPQPYPGISPPLHPPVLIKLQPLYRDYVLHLDSILETRKYRGDHAIHHIISEIPGMGGAAFRDPKTGRLIGYDDNLDEKLAYARRLGLDVRVFPMEYFGFRRGETVLTEDGRNFVNALVAYKNQIPEWRQVLAYEYEGHIPFSAEAKEAEAFFRFQGLHPAARSAAAPQAPRPGFPAGHPQGL